MASPALAEGPVLSFGGLITSDLIRSGESLSDGRPGFGLEAGIEQAGFFAGLELLSLRGGADRWQGELSLGYRWAQEAWGMEFGVARAWGDASGAGDTEVFAGLELALGERTSLGLEAVYAPRPREWTDLNLTLTQALTDRLDLSARLGRVPADGFGYGDIGVTYGLGESAALDLRYHRSREIGARVTATLLFALGGN